MKYEMQALQSQKNQPAPQATPAIFWRETGSGKPLILIHGFGSSGETLSDTAQALASQYRVIVPDLRGHGQSVGLPPAESIEQLADDVLRVADHLGIERFCLCGYSMGGAVAQAIVLRAPERVERLALGGTFAYKHLTWLERLTALIGILVVWILGPRGMAWFMHPWFSGGKSVNAIQLKRLRQAIRLTTRRHLVACLRAILKWDSRTRLAEIRCPTLVITGKRDTLVPPRHARMLTDGIAGAQLTEFDDAGHPLVYTHAREMAACVAGFCL